LIELLVVVVIIAILIGMTIPAFNSLMNTRGVTQAADMLINQLSYARQAAVGQSMKMEFRFLSYKDPSLPGDPAGGACHAVQVYLINAQSISQPLTKVVTLPDSVVMDSGTNFSSLLSGASYPSNGATPPSIPRVGTSYTYHSFIFNSDGSTDLAPGNQWFVTVHNARQQPSGQTPPHDFATVEIDPLDGSLRTFRP